MNQQKVYDAIIQKAKSENRIRFNKKDPKYIYYENHHIIPACMNGSDNSFNRILLTAREHYICHKLLTYIYKGNKKLVDAFWRMTFNKNKNHIKSARDYAYARELFSLTPKTKETCEKISKGNTGKKYSNDINKKKGRKGRIVSIETGKRISNSLIISLKNQSDETKKNRAAANIGQKRTQETKNNISKALTGKKQSEETKEKRNKKLTGKKRKAFSQKTKNKMRDAKFGKTGANKGKKYKLKIKYNEKII
jgi:hypothetical protein